MRLSYSKDVDILVIELSEKAPVESEHFEKYGIIVDYAEDGEIVGLEVLDWSKRCSSLEIPVVGKFVSLLDTV